MGQGWNRLIGSSRDGQRVPDPRKVPPPVSNVGANESFHTLPDGTTLFGIDVTWIAPTYYGNVTVDVWYQLSGEGTAAWMYAGRTRRSPFKIQGADLTPGQTFVVAVCTVSAVEMTIGPDASPQATVTLAQGSLQPPDITGFTVIDYGPDLLFQWTPVNSDAYPYVMGYEIRAGATGWSSATFVAKAPLRNTPWWPVPRPLAPGTSFYLKAVSYAEVYSATPASASLAAEDATSVDAASTGTYYQEATIAAGTQSVTYTSKGQFASAPYFGIAASVAGYGGTFDGTTFSQNGDGTWSATLYGDDVAPAGGATILALEAGPRQ